MKRTDLSTRACPIARSLDRVGEWWSILILRDTFYGLTRFDELQKSLDIAPNMLSRRLSDLVEAGLLERVQYADRPPRYEYLPTELARDFRPVMLALVAWGNRHFSPEGPAVQLVERATGRPVRAGLVDLDTGKPITPADHVMAPGPGATDETRYRFAYVEQKRAANAADLRFTPPASARKAS